MPFWDTLHGLMPTFFPAVKSAGQGALPMPSGQGGRTFWWGNGSGPIFPGGGLNVGRSIDYAQAAGDVTQNSAVAACINWISTNWADAPVRVGVQEGGKFAPVEHHPLQALLDQPNEDYNGKWLMWALLADYYRYGRAYVHIVSAGGQPKELQYLPAAVTTSVAGPDGRRSHYAYKPGNVVIRVPCDAVVHFRFGVDPCNVLEGVSPLGPVLVEIVSDNACARYPANVMHHGGLPPGVLVPKPQAAGDLTQPLTPELARILTDAFNEKRQADPGKIPLVSAPLELVLLGWKPSEMVLNDLREEPETRIAAQFGIPCLVAGLRAGLIRSTYSNSEQANKAAWTNCLVPLQKSFASEWTRQLLPLFPGSDGMTVEYLHSEVGVLQEDKMARRDTARKDFAAGVLTHEEVRAEQGRSPLSDAEKEKVGGQTTPAEDRGGPPEQKASE